jgi:hypothetical protein
MNAIHQVTWAFLVLLLLALTPAPARASKAATARHRGFTYRDRTPRVHDTTPKRPYRQKNQ